MQFGPIEQFVGIVVGLFTILGFTVSTVNRLDNLKELPENIEEIKRTQEEIQATQDQTRRNLEATQAGVIATAYRVQEENGFELDLEKIDRHYSQDKPPEDTRPSDYINWDDGHEDYL